MEFGTLRNKNKIEKSNRSIIVIEEFIDKAEEWIEEKHNPDGQFDHRRAETHGRPTLLDNSPLRLELLHRRSLSAEGGEEKGELE